MPNLLTYLFVALFGLIFGSFANVMILRDAKRASIVTGRSECPHCHHELRWYELIPVLSFLLQLGRCRSCNKRLSWQYPVVEVSMALLALVAYCAGGGEVLPSLFFGVSLFFFLIISGIDIRTQMISLEYVFVGGVAGGFAQILTGTSLYAIALAAATSGLFLLIVRFLWKVLMHQEGMGEGDLWLAGALGLLVGFPASLSMLIVSIFAGAIIGVCVLIVAKKGFETALPFGPFLFFGALVALLWGESLVTWYTTTSGLALYL
jgi:prepilin signal peptidase PulO-like enzyme (type II secretory pathway)